MPDLPFKPVTVGLLEVNCCLVQLPGSRTLYIIDPGDDWKLIESEARSFDYDEAVILFTHAHVDHISAAGDVADALNVRRVCLHPADKPIYYSPGNTVGNYIPAAEDLPDTTWPPNDPRMQVLLCPGHSPGGVSYYFPELATVFSGDLWRLAQARPGTRVTFRRIELAAAQKLHARAEKEYRRLARGKGWITR